MADDYPSVSIIILNYNGTQWNERCLASLKQLDYPRESLEIIFADNASTDQSVHWVLENFPELEVVRHSKNYGFCKGNNLAAKKAKGKYLVFLNNDTYVAKDWLRELVKPAERDLKTAVVAGKIFFGHEAQKHLINAAGGIILPSGNGLYNGWMEENSLKWDCESKTGFACGAGMLVRRDFFEATGGFDEYFFYSGEEMDIGYRAWMMGYQVMYAPKAVMHHYMGGTGFRGKGVTPIVEYLISRNMLYFLLKNFEFGTAVKGLLLYKAKAWAKMIYAIRKGRWRVVLSIHRAEWDIARNLFKILRKRAAMKQMRKMKDKELRQMGALTGVFEAIKRHQSILRQLKINDVNDYYDETDMMDMVCDEDGDYVFTKV